MDSITPKYDVLITYEPDVGVFIIQKERVNAVPQKFYYPIIRHTLKGSIIQEGLLGSVEDFFIGKDYAITLNQVVGLEKSKTFEYSIENMDLLEKELHILMRNGFNQHNSYLQQYIEDALKQQSE
jgi:hypothetical protein